jgi:hypothetical protein
MTLNPELRRYMWVDATPGRIAGLVAVLGALFVVAWLVGQQPYTQTLLGIERTTPMAYLATIAFYVVTLGWGTRRAAAAVAEEIREHTWDGQRMSAMGAWDMTWGKLLGSTALTWTGALLCLAVYAMAEIVAGDPITDVAEIVGLRIGVALVAQVVALAASLVWLRKRGRVGRVPTILCQLVGIAVGFGLSIGYRELSQAEMVFGAHIFWYGFAIDRDNFILAGLAAVLAWGLMAAYRQMRAALQFRNWPWVWLVFMACLMGFADGFFYPTSENGSVHPAIWLSLPFALAAALTYITLFAEAKDPVALRGCFGALARGRTDAALALMPLWLVTMIVTFVLGVAMIVVIAVDPLVGESHLMPELRDTLYRIPGLLAILCFLLRDFALVLGISLDAERRRGDIPALVVLILLYALGGWIVDGLRAEALRPIVRPQYMGDFALSVLPVALEALLAVAYLSMRWRAATRPFRAAARPDVVPEPSS